MSEGGLARSRLVRARWDGDAAPRRDGRWVIRDVDTERDLDAVIGLDTSHASDQVYAVHRSGDVVALAPTATAMCNRQPVIDLTGSPWAHARVAELDGAVRGLIAWELNAATRRLVVRHFYVDRAYRRRGGGRRLMDVALGWAREAGAAVVWLATSSASYPAIAACRRLGFELCGFDAAPGLAIGGPGEVAVYLARTVEGSDGER